MAEFCSNCTPEYFDIDLMAEALQLKPGYSYNVLCEGCNIRAIYKDEDGRLYLGRIVDGEIQLDLVQLENL